MKRLLSIIIAIFLFLCIWKICDYIVPHSPFDPDDERTKLINQHWDKLKHAFYIIVIGITAYSNYFERDERFEKYVKLFSAVFVIGILIPALLVKPISEKVKPEPIDYLFILFSFLHGCKGVFPEKHAYFGSKLMGKNIYTFLYGNEEARGTSKL